ncbi:uncharacterized protein M6B38_261765 [Iris pallida]|uniref:Uncharacterized protein n=1 Tax=Iris pallida TaxID=29817 RepID=A0AAX6IDD0_IRIPA|nr:uncharacterized protein M6B38_340870 [Iris pallida]KAJ6851266.1 uncharacterized protein M6B38_261765 [Iris pallida]
MFGVTVYPKVDYSFIAALGITKYMLEFYSLTVLREAITLLWSRNSKHVSCCNYCF